MMDHSATKNSQAVCIKCKLTNTPLRRSNKLVRDNIPDIIIANGEKPKVIVLTGEPLLEALNEKLLEEHEEYLSEPNEAKSVEELADMFEVILCLAKNKGVSREDFLAIAAAKALKNGAFDKGYFLQGKE